MICLTVLTLFIYFLNAPQETLDVRITNVTESSVTITWRSKTETKGKAYISEEDSWFPLFSTLFKRSEVDERDYELNDDGIETKTKDVDRSIHSVVFSNLQPESEYYLKIGNNIRGGETIKVNTRTVSEKVSVPEIFYGSLENMKQQSINYEGVLRFQIKTAENETEWYSTLINESGNFSGDIGSLINSDDSLHKLDTKSDEMFMEILSQDAQYNYNIPLKATYKPLPVITLNLQQDEENTVLGTDSEAFCQSQCSNPTGGWDFGSRTGETWCGCCANNCGDLNQECRRQINFNTPDGFVDNYNILCQNFNFDSGNIYVGKPVGESCNWDGYKKSCEPGNRDRSTSKEWIARCTGGVVSEAYVQLNPNCGDPKFWGGNVDNPILDPEKPYTDYAADFDNISLDWGNLDYTNLSSKDRNKITLTYCYNQTNGSFCETLPSLELYRGNGFVRRYINLIDLSSTSTDIRWILQFEKESVNCTASPNDADLSFIESGHIYKIYNSIPITKTIELPIIVCESSTVEELPPDKAEPIVIDVLPIIYKDASKPGFNPSLFFSSNTEQLLISIESVMEEASRSKYKNGEFDPSAKKNIDIVRKPTYNWNKFPEQLGINCDLYLERALRGNWSQKNWQDTNCWGGSTIDTNKFIAENRICSLIENGEIDEVWVVTFGNGGMWETMLLQDDSSTPQLGLDRLGVKTITEGCKRDFIVQGFVYDRELEQAIHTLGHRAETLLNYFLPEEFREFSTMEYRYSEETDYIWGVSTDPIISCGSTHNPPNAYKDYDYSAIDESRIDRGLDEAVFSDCNDWNPSHTGVKERINCTEWGCNEIGYQSWWFSHFPGPNSELTKLDGTPMPNWWEIFTHFDNPSTPTEPEPTVPQVEEPEIIEVPLPEIEEPVVPSEEPTEEPVDPNRFNYGVVIPTLDDVPIKASNINSSSLSSTYKTAFQEVMVSNAYGGEWIREILSDMGVSDTSTFLSNLNIYFGEDTNKILESRACSLGTTPYTSQNGEVVMLGIGFSNSMTNIYSIRNLIVEEITQFKQYENIPQELFNSDDYFAGSKFERSENLVAGLNDGVPPGSEARFLELTSGWRALLEVAQHKFIKNHIPSWNYMSYDVQIDGVTYDNGNIGAAFTALVNRINEITGDSWSEEEVLDALIDNRSKFIEINNSLNRFSYSRGGQNVEVNLWDLIEITDRALNCDVEFYQGIEGDNWSVVEAMGVPNDQNIWVKKVMASSPEKLDSGLYEISVNDRLVITYQIEQDNFVFKFYVDKNNNSLKDSDEEYIDNTEKIKIDKRGSVQTFDLAAGYNLIHIALVNTQITNAYGLVDHLLDQGFEVGEVTVYQNNMWIPLKVSLNENGNIEYFGKNFSIYPGQGIFIKVQKQGNFSLTGNLLEKNQIFLNNGWNLIGLNTNQYDSEQLVEKCNQDDFKCDTLASYEYGIYHSIVKEDGVTYGVSFPLNRNKGYFLRVSELPSTGNEFSP